MNKRLITLTIIVIIITGLIIGSAGCLPTFKAETATPSMATPVPSETVSAPTATLEPAATPTISPTTPPTPETQYGDGRRLISLPDFIPVVEKIKPAVVLITTEVTTYSIFLQPIPQEGAGTGVIFDSRGYIVTNNHVVEDAKSITVTLFDGKTYNATLVGTDVWTDLAVIKIEGDSFPTAQFADPKSIRSYIWVLAIGFPFKLSGDPTVTPGIISATGRSIEEENGIVLYDLIQTDAAINPGNSGGPLVNLAGEVVGINTAIISGAQNIGFTIHVSTVIPVMKEIVSRGYVARPWLGVNLQTVNSMLAQRYGLPASEGVLITTVTRDGPAARSGLKEGDIVLKFGDVKVTTVEELRQAIQSHKVGEIVQVTFLRKSKTEQTVEVTLGETPPSR